MHIKCKNQIYNQLLVVVDFKENISIGGGPRELNSDYFSRTPRTVLGFVLYYIENGKMRKKHVNIISDVLSHDALFVKYAFQK